MKLEQGGAYGDVVLTDTTVSTDLGNGWYQVVLPMSGFANVAPAVGVLFEASVHRTRTAVRRSASWPPTLALITPRRWWRYGVIPEDVFYATDPG